MEQSRLEVGLVMTLYGHVMDFTYEYCMQEALLLQDCNNHSKPHFCDIQDIFAMLRKY